MKKNWVSLTVFAVIVIGFELSLTLAHISTFIFPKPSLIVKALIENWQWILDNLWVTLSEALIGFGISILLGIGLALLHEFVPGLRSIILNFTIAIRNVPFVAISPILFLLLGYGQTAKIVIVIVVSFYPIMTNLIAGFANVNQNQMERFFVLRASRWQLFTKLQLPSSIPYLIAGLEIAGSNMIIAAIVGELLGTTKGLGFVIVMAVSQYRFALLMAAVVVTTIMSIGLTWLMKLLARILFKKWLV